MAEFGCGGINFEIKKLKLVVGSLEKKKKKNGYRIFNSINQ